MDNEIDKLLEELETAEDDGVSNYDTSVTYFLKTHNIEPGNDPIGLSLLYKLYKLTLPTPITYRAFTRQINALLDGKNRKVFINLKSTKISEEVMKSLEKKKRRNYNKGIKSFKHFISKYNIKAGNGWLEGRVLFELYKNSFRQMKKRPFLTLSEFYRFCDIYFRKEYSDGVLFYGIDECIYQRVSKEELEKLRYETRKEKTKEKRRSKKT